MGCAIAWRHAIARPIAYVCCCNERNVCQALIAALELRCVEHVDLRPPRNMTSKGNRMATAPCLLLESAQRCLCNVAEGVLVVSGSADKRCDGVLMLESATDLQGCNWWVDVGTIGSPIERAAAHRWPFATSCHRRE